MPDRDQLMARQRVLADFGELALRSEDLDEVLTEACRLVGAALGTGRAKILEIVDGGAALLVRAGVGWPPDVVGVVRIPMDERSSETFSIAAGAPVYTPDIAAETRFDVPDFLREAGVVALVNVPIRLPGSGTFGLLQVDSREPRDFGEAETDFLRTYATILGPVIDRLQKITELRSSDERFRLIVENARDYAIFMTDPDDRITDWLAGAEAVFGWTAAEIVGQSARILFTPEDRARGEDRAEIEQARREGSAPDVRWHLRKDGARVFIEGSTMALRDRQGRVRGFFKIGHDVTAAKETALRMEVLVKELEHRGRNLLGIVASIANRTLREGGSVGDFMVRLQALGRAQALLSDAGGEAADVGAIVREELAAHIAVGAPKVVLRGPSAALNARQVQNFALAVHELATNAVKYGALRGEAGRLAVSWAAVERDGRPWLDLSWVERGVALPADAGARRGYGRELIENALSYALGARTTFELAPDGVRCEIALPLG